MNYKSIIESILYVSGEEGIEINEIKKVIDLPTNDIRNLIKELSQQYGNNSDSGLLIKVYGDHYYMLTKPENKDVLSKLIEIKTKNPLNQPLLETLAIIAYNQPCTRGKIEEIRNMDPSYAIDKLENLDLIKNVGRADTPGSPYLYEVTQKFFDLFGIKSLKELPELNNIEFVADEDINFFDINRQ